MQCAKGRIVKGINSRNGPEDDCDQNEDGKRKQWFCGKWGFCATRGTVRWKDKQYEKNDDGHYCPFSRLKRIVLVKQSISVYEKMKFL